MQVRAATPADAEALASLSGQLGYPADVPTILRRLAQVEHGVVLVALDAKGAVCAVAHAEPRHLLIAEPLVELEALVVDEAVRGAGAGAMLLAAVEAWARERDFSSVRVRSNVLRERAQRFYQRKGYIEKKRQAVFLKRLQATNART
ncbi:MAG: GNAT family N-acetyltransferase [Rhodanobacteraceae bacterium]